MNKSVSLLKFILSLTIIIQLNPKSSYSATLQELCGYTEMSRLSGNNSKLDLINGVDCLRSSTSTVLNEQVESIIDIINGLEKEIDTSDKYWMMEDQYSQLLTEVDTFNAELMEEQVTTLLRTTDDQSNSLLDLLKNYPNASSIKKSLNGQQKEKKAMFRNLLATIKSSEKGREVLACFRSGHPGEMTDLFEVMDTDEYEDAGAIYSYDTRKIIINSNAIVSPIDFMNLIVHEMSHGCDNSGTDSFLRSQLDAVNDAQEQYKSFESENLVAWISLQSPLSELSENGIQDEVVDSLTDALLISNGDFSEFKRALEDLEPLLKERILNFEQEDLFSGETFSMAQLIHNWESSSNQFQASEQEYQDKLKKLSQARVLSEIKAYAAVPIFYGELIENMAGNLAPGNNLRHILCSIGVFHEGFGGSVPLGYLQWEKQQLIAQLKTDLNVDVNNLNNPSYAFLLEDLLPSYISMGIFESEDVLSEDGESLNAELLDYLRQNVSEIP